VTSFRAATQGLPLDAAGLQATALEKVSNAVVITDGDATILWANPAFAAMTGYTVEEAVGETPRMLKSGTHDAAFYHDLWTTILSGRTWCGELANRRKDGSLYHGEQTITPILSEAGRITHFIGVMNDVTARKKAEDELRQAQKLEAIGSLAGGIAHDFNNLLTIMTGRSQLAAWHLEPTSPVRHHLGLIDETVERAAGLTRQLLAFSRKQILEPRVLSVADVVASLAKMLRRLIPESIELVTKSAGDLWHVKADLSQIEQVVLNLSVNARDAMPDGGRLALETTNVEVDDGYARTHVEPGEYVMLAVSDTGCGMSPEVQAKLFEPFFTTKEPAKGTGLGLSTVYGIVKQSGGHISFHSEAGRGTTFEVYLPRVTEPLSTVAARPTSPVRGGETVLVVEDDDQVRALAAETLRFTGYTVLDASNPGDALALMERHGSAVRLLLTDMVMPGMNGTDLAERLVARRPTLKVLYMSGYPSSRIASGALRGRIRFLQKPFTLGGLTQKVRDVLDAGS
jgi:PAS domain S-box-containing protein